MKSIYYLIFTVFFTIKLNAQETISFPSGDGLIDVTADKYIDDSNTEFILLCHQAGYSRGEYIETAPIFVSKGYNCMAIDQRSGKAINGVTNQTAAAAKEAGIAQGFTNTIPDIAAAIDHAYALNNNNPIYLLGSSYSSSLALVLGRDNVKVKATLAFSPGEYLSGIDVTAEVSRYAKPIFVTSSRSESSGVADLVTGVDATYKTHFQPTVAGLHGSKTLWSSTDGHEQYWTAMESFLSPLTLNNKENIPLEFSIYPNPSKNIIFIKSQSTIKKIEMINLSGLIILTSKNENKVDLSFIEKGTYIMKVYTKKGIGSRKVIHE